MDEVRDDNDDIRYNHEKNKKEGIAAMANEEENDESELKEIIEK
jgi:hypothetical protein